MDGKRREWRENEEKRENEVTIEYGLSSPIINSIGLDSTQKNKNQKNRYSYLKSSSSLSQ